MQQPSFGFESGLCRPHVSLCTFFLLNCSLKKHAPFMFSFVLWPNKEKIDSVISGAHPQPEKWWKDYPLSTIGTSYCWWYRRKIRSKEYIPWTDMMGCQEENYGEDIWRLKMLKLFIIPSGSTAGCFTSWTWHHSPLRVHFRRFWHHIDTTYFEAVRQKQVQSDSPGPKKGQHII